MLLFDYFFFNNVEILEKIITSILEDHVSLVDLLKNIRKKNQHDMNIIYIKIQKPTIKIDHKS
jgi:hypothetical protein